MLRNHLSYAGGSPRLAQELHLQTLPQLPEQSPRRIVSYCNLNVTQSLIFN